MLFVVLSSCLSKQNESKEPVRKSGIPKTAFWVGGVDGGNWYSVDNVSSQRNSAMIKIYDESDGSLIIDKKFFLVCRSDSTVLIQNLRKQITAFDRERIYLETGSSSVCWLQ